MKTLRKLDLDELARTMNVIPETKLNLFLGGSGSTSGSYTGSGTSEDPYQLPEVVIYAPGTVKNYPTKDSLNADLSRWATPSNPNYTEVQYYHNTNDNTWTVARDTANTDSTCVFWINGSPNKRYNPYNGKPIDESGHTHIYSSDLSSADSAAYGMFPDLNKSVFYNGTFMSK